MFVRFPGSRLTRTVTLCLAADLQLTWCVRRRRVRQLWLDQNFPTELTCLPYTDDVQTSWCARYFYCMYATSVSNEYYAYYELVASMPSALANPASMKLSFLKYRKNIYIYLHVD